MHKKTLLLLRLLSSGDMDLNSMFSGKKAKGRLGLSFGGSSKSGQLLLQVFVLAMGGFAMFNASYANCRMLAMSGSLDLMPPMLFRMTALLNILMGFMYVVSTLYHSSSNEILLSMPFKPAELIAARYLQAGLTIIVIDIMYLTTGLFAYAWTGGSPWYFYPLAVLLAVILPYMTLAPVTVVVIVLFRFSRFMRNKDRFMLFSSLLILLAALGMGASTGFMQSGSSASSADALSSVSAKLGVVNWVFPGLGFAIDFVLGFGKSEAWLSFLLLLVCTLALFALVIAVGQLWYLDGVRSMFSSPSKRRALVGKDMRKLAGGRSALRALMSNDLLFLLRSPAFMINNVLGALLIPFLFVGIAIYNILKDPAVLAQVRAASESVFSDMQILNEGSTVILAVLFVANAFIMGSNGIAATSFSREGPQACMGNLYPVSFRTRITAKLVLAMLFSLLMPLIIITALLILGAPVALVLSLALMFTLELFMLNLLGLWADMQWPKLNWSTEQQAAKQNTNVLIQMFGGVLIAAAPFTLIYALTELVAPTYYAKIIMLCVYSLAISALFWYLLSSERAQRKFKRKISEGV